MKASLTFSVILRMMSDVLRCSTDIFRCSQDALNCSQMFYGHSQMFGLVSLLGSCESNWLGGSRGPTWILKTRLIKKNTNHFFSRKSCRKLQNHSKNVSLKIGTTSPQKLSQIFKNGEKLHYKIRRSKGQKYP